MKRNENRAVMRAAIYARFSTAKQNTRSTDDQIVLCRQYADREGYTVVKIYADKAKSGATVVGRDGYDMMVQDMRDGVFDAIIVEELDRLSRDMGDLYELHRLSQHLEIPLVSVHEGRANTVTVGIRGLVGQLYREDNVHKVRRGMAGLVSQGLSAGGRAYGYRPDPANKGKLIIVPEEEEVIVRCFREYADGRSSRDIARRLNNDGIPAPRSETWSASTLNGSLDRGYGILHNELYRGKLVWNRVRMLKDPDTGRRVSRSNPQTEWQYKDVPECRIVSDELWDAVHARYRKPKERLVDNRRPKRMLSGLLKCGSCGSGMCVQGPDKSGRPRIRCSAHVNKGTCPGPFTAYLDEVETQVLDSLKEELEHPDVIASFLAGYHAELETINRELVAKRRRLERLIEGHNSKLRQLMDWGLEKPDARALAEQRMDEVGAELRAAREDLEKLPVPGKVMALHPDLLSIYAEQLKDLRATLDQGQAAGQMPQSEALRDIVSYVIVKKNPETGVVETEIHGVMNALLGVPGEGLKPGGLIVGSGRRT